MHRVFLALGSNVGDKTAHVERAILLLKEKIVDLRSAKMYQTKPWGYEAQDDFVNTVVEGQTDLSPQELFRFVKEVEKQVGRIERFKWGPREIDIDILFYDDLVVKEDHLKIPHPHLQEREFVLLPLLDTAPEFVHPIFRKTVKELYGDLLRKLKKSEEL
jgi:2-amino-4-hydroxy-6-hydroxymethyldihydropteridine diphosphokinase